MQQPAATNRNHHQGPRIEDTMREMFAFALWALVASLLGVVSTHGLKIQTVANRQAIINKFPGCVILGTPSWPSNTVMNMTKASSAGQCRDKCMDGWKASKRRGIELWDNDGWNAAFRHEGCYLEYPQFGDSGESCARRRTGDLNQFEHDSTEGWKAWPCYKGTLHSGDASTDPLTTIATFGYSDSIQNKNLGEKSTGSADKLNVHIKNSPYICNWSRNNKGWGATGDHYPCLSWTYRGDKSICELHLEKPLLDGYFTAVGSFINDTRFTGDMYCENDFNKENIARDVANLYQAPGCMKHHYNWPGADLYGLDGVSDPHECRRRCQKNSDCVIFVYARERKRCFFKTAQAYDNEYETPNEDVYAGMKDCHTCLPGYYISDTRPADGIDSCRICPKGNYCSEGEKIPCEAGKFCGVEGLAAPLDPSSENRCDADHSGSGCEHRVCRDSALGEKLSALAFKEPIDFDFSAYAIPTNAERAGGWKLVLSAPRTSSEVQTLVYVESAFTEMIRSSIVEEYYFIVSSISWPYPSWITWKNYLTDCSLADDWSPRLALDGNLEVGDNITACLRLRYREVFRPLTWFDQSEMYPDGLKETTQSCVTQTISLVARGKVLVNNINTASGLQNVVLQYKIGTSEETFQAVTNAIGEVTLDISDDNVTYASVDSSITFVSASQTGIETDIKLCPDDDDVDCTVDNVRSLPATYSLTHLQTRQLRLVDVLGRHTLAGRISQTFGSTGSCRVGGVLVEAINVATDQVVAYTTSSSVDGSFALNVPINTQTQLVLTYGDHTFDAADSGDAVTTALLSGSGRQVDDNLASLEISDTTQRVLRLRAGATECDFGVGTVDVAIQVHACPGVVLARTTSNVITDWTLPAANYTLSLDFPDDEDVQTSFEYQFSTSDARFVSLDMKDGLMEMLHQPIPVIDLSVRAGNLFFDTASCTEVPFDTIIEGGRTIPIRITSTQTYKSETCGTLPGGTVMKVVSNLAPEIDVDCDPNAPCEFAFAAAEVNSESRSVATASVVCGEPQQPLEDGASQGVDEFIRSVEFSMRNPRVWDNATAGLEATLDALVLGDKSIRESSTIVFSSEDSIPLHYLYAPPGGDGSYASMSFDGSFTVQSSTQAVVETESGMHTRTTVSASVGSSSASLYASAGLLFERVDAQVESHGDHVEVSTTSRSFTLTTSTAETGSAVDQVMFIGSVAQFSEAVHLSFDEETCMVTSADSIAWGNQVASLVIQTRRACEDSLDLIERTIEVEGDNAESADLVAQARLERERWLSLLQHWENDYLAALKNPIDLAGQNLFEGTTTAVNRIQISDADIDIVDSVSGQVDSVVDYESFSSSNSLDVSLGNASTSAYVDLWLGLIGATAGVSHETSVVQTTSVERETSEGEAMSTSISTHLALAGDGNSICVELFRSPFSGTHVYRVCGGLTSCPNVPGTGAREVIALTYYDEPAIELTENTGSFSFYIDASSMPVSSDYITLAITVDAQSATGGILYSVAGTSLNPKIEVDVRAQSQQLVTVSYERLNERIRSTTVIIEVTSVCDDKVSRTLPFDLNWASTCPTISWAGTLTDATATWALTSDLPTTPIVFSRGSASDSSVTSTVSLWAARYDGSATFGDWFEVTSFAAGSTAMDLTAAELQAKTSSEGRFLFELRASCAVEGRSVGSTRSGQRLGVLDTIGPVLMAWAPASKVRVATSSFPVANFRFDEPVDCGHADLEAIITDASGELSATTSISCASRLYDLTVVMETADAAAVALWSNTTVTMELRGVHDLHGNVAEVITAGGRRRALADGSVSKTFVVPTLPEHGEDTATLAQWGTQTDSERRAAVAVAYARVFPGDAAVASSYVESEDDQGTDGADSLMLGVALGVTAGVVAVVAAAFLIIRRRRREQGKRRSTASDAVSADTEMHAKVENSNPMHAEA